MLKRFGKICLIGVVGICICALSPFRDADAAEGQTAVTITFNPIIILHYYNQLNLEFESLNNDVNFNEGNRNNEIADLLPTVTFSTETLNLTGYPNVGSLGNVNVTVQDVWAVRGIADSTGTGQLRVEAAINGDGIASTGSSQAVMSNLWVAESGQTASGNFITFDAPGLAYDKAVHGDINFDLDIENVTLSGAHTGILYTITASAP